MVVPLTFPIQVEVEELKGDKEFHFKQAEMWDYKIMVGARA